MRRGEQEPERGKSACRQRQCGDLADQRPAPGERGKGGRVTLLADGKQIGRGELPQSVAAIYALNEGLDVGADYGSSVADYALPATFTGRLEQVVIDFE